MPTQLAPPSVHRTDSQRSDGSRRVTFRRGVHVQRVPASRPAPVLRRQPPPASADEVARQAEDIIRQLDSVTCDVRTTERPIDNGLRPPELQQADKVGTLNRASLRKKKGKSAGKTGSRAGSVKSVSTNTLPPPASHSSTLDADKNNILKAESLRREREGELCRLQVNGLLKRSSSQVDHLNNLNSLKDVDDRYNNYPDKLRLSSEDRDSRDSNIRRKHVNSKLSSKPSHRSTPTLPTIHITPEYEAPKKVSHATSQTSPRRLEADTMPRQAPPPRPDRVPGHYRPVHGFSYIGREDTQRIGHADSVESRSRHIIDQIARSRSRSPDLKPARAPPRSRSSSPDPAPGLRSYNVESSRGRYGYEPPEEPRGYDYDPSRLTRKYDYEPSGGQRPYDYDPSPVMTRTYREESPPITSSYDMFDSPAIRVTRPDAPPVTHTFRYEYDSSGEPRTFRDDEPVTRTRTYHFQSEPVDPPQERRKHVETTRSYRFQEDALDSSFELSDPRRNRYGSSIVMIGEQPPEIVSAAVRRGTQPAERSPRLSTVKEGSVPSDEEQHYRAPRRAGLYSVPRQSTPRETENVIRLSVSGSHSSGAPDGAEPRHVDRQQSAGFDTSPERPRGSPSDTGERRRTDVSTRRVDVRRADTTRHVSSSSESPRRRDSRDPSEERRPTRAVNGHRRVTRESRESRDSRGHGTIERARRRTEHDRHHDAKHRHDRKKNFEIKFMYDDDKDEPSDVRLAKFSEYRGSEEGASPSPRSGRRRRDERHAPDGDPSWRPDKGDGKGPFLTRVESSRLQTSERRDGRDESPRHRPRDTDLHGEWSSRTDEDRVDAGYHRSERVRTTRHSDDPRRDDREKTHSSVSSDDNKRHRSRGRSSSPERRSREKSVETSPGKSTEKPKKKGWLSATLSRLDLRKSSDDRRRSHSPKRRNSHSPEQRRDKFSPERPAPSGPASGERREKRASSGHGTTSRRRDGRSGSRDSYGTSEDRGQLSSDRERPSRGHRGSADRRERRSGSRELLSSHEGRSSHETRRRPAAENRSSDRESRHYLSSDTQERRGGRASVDRRSERKEVRGGGRPTSRTASFSRRYPEDEPDAAHGGTSRRPASRRPSGAGSGPGRGRRSSHSVTSSLNSSGSDPGGQTASRASAAGDRSVYLHATTVADIPSPDGPDAQQADSEPLPSRERRKVSRSFSMLTPFKIKHHDKSINYENEKNAKDGRANGRPPRAPRPRRGSRDELDDRSAERSPERRRQPVSRSSSLPKGSRSAYRSEDRPAR